MAKSKQRKKYHTFHPTPAPPRPPMVIHEEKREINFFRGIIPSPETLEKYDAILPGSPERILAMAERQATHRQDLEARVIQSDIRNSRLGLHYGLIIGLAAIGGGCFVAAMGHAIGALISSAGLASLVGVFVYGSRQKRAEREKRLTQIRGGKAPARTE